MSKRCTVGHHEKAAICSQPLIHFFCSTNSSRVAVFVYPAMGKEDPAGLSSLNPLVYCFGDDLVLMPLIVGRVRVYVRARPPNGQESADPDFVNVLDVSPEENRITVKRELEAPKVFYFDNVFQQTVTQEEVYTAVAQPIVQVRLSLF
jgi:hypothetical protein